HGRCAPTKEGCPAEPVRGNGAPHEDAIRWDGAPADRLPRRITRRVGDGERPDACHPMAEKVRAGGDAPARGARRAPLASSSAGDGDPPSPPELHAPKPVRPSVPLAWPARPHLSLPPPCGREAE